MSLTAWKRKPVVSGSTPVVTEAGVAVQGTGGDQQQTVS